MLSNSVRLDDERIVALLHDPPSSLWRIVTRKSQGPTQQLTLTTEAFYAIIELFHRGMEHPDARP